MFLECDFKTNIYCTFKSHKNRKHCNHTLVDFKPEVVTTTTISVVNEVEENCEEYVEQSDTAIHLNNYSQTCDLVRDIFHRRNLFVDECVIRETVYAIFFSGNPVQRSIQKVAL